LKKPRFKIVAAELALPKKRKVERGQWIEKNDKLKMKNEKCKM